MTDAFGSGFVRDSSGRLVFSTGGKEGWVSGFVRDEFGRIVIAGPQGTGLSQRGGIHGQPILTRAASLTAALLNETKQSDGVKLGETSRLKAKAIRDGGGLRFVYGNWSKQNEQSAENTITVKAGVENPNGGNPIPVNFGGKETVELMRGMYVVSDVVPMDVAKGQVVYHRTYVKVAEAGLKWTLDRATVVADGEGVTPTNLDKAQATGEVEAKETVVYGPCLVLAVSPSVPVPVVGKLGDSIIAGKADTPLDRGWFNIALNEEYAYVDMAKGGGLAQQNAEYSASQGRMQLLDFCSHVVVAYGVNDLNAARTVAQLKSDLETIVTRLTRRGIKAILATITPVATSSDSFATVANQTPSATNSKRLEVNEWINTKPTGVSAVIDVASAVESSAGSGKWKVGMTEEGTHPIKAGHEAMAAKFTPASVIA